MPKKAKGRKRFIEELIDNIKAESKLMSVNDKNNNRGVKGGIILIKYDNAGSNLTIFPVMAMGHKSGVAQLMNNVLRETNEKFANHKSNDYKRVLILINPISDWNFITDLIKVKLQSTITLTFIDEIYEISFDLRWDDYAIGIGRCQPKPFCQYLCHPSKLFKTQKEYTNEILKYFCSIKMTNP